MTTGEIYHICNKAVDAKPIFLSSNERQYFLETALLVNTNDKRLLDWRRGRFRNSGLLMLEGHDPMVEVYALSLMPDHFHFLVKQLVDGGIAQYCHRLCNSFGRTYNIVHKRKGRLFIGSYKAVHIKSDAQAAHIFTYIHANPLDLVEPDWRSGNIKNWKKSHDFLANYQWSSLGVYTGGNTNPLLQKIIKKDFAENYFSGQKDYYEGIREWGSRSEESDIDSDQLE